MNDISFEKLQQELQESAPVLRVHGRAFPVVNVPGTATKPGFTVWIRNNTEIMVILNESEDSFECRDITAGEYCRLEKVMR